MKIENWEELIVPLNRIFIRGLVTLMISFTAANLGVAEEYVVVDQQLDRSEDGIKKTKSLSISREEFEFLSKQKFACINLVVFLDGKTEEVLTSSGYDSNSREAVDCYPGNYGPLQMSEGIEYYVNSFGISGRIGLSIFPGFRDYDPYNDVTCIPGSIIDKRKRNFAAIRFRGFYAVRFNDYGEIANVVLTPPISPPSDKSIDNCIKSFN